MTRRIQIIHTQAKHVDADGFVTDSYEQKFSVPDDVDTARLSSGISKVGLVQFHVKRFTIRNILILLQGRRADDPRAEEAYGGGPADPHPV